MCISVPAMRITGKHAALFARQLRPHFMSENVFPVATNLCTMM
jgi:hypothetical protein